MSLKECVSFVGVALMLVAPAIMFSGYAGMIRNAMQGPNPRVDVKRILMTSKWTRQDNQQRGKLVLIGALTGGLGCLSLLAGTLWIH